MKKIITISLLSLAMVAGVLWQTSQSSDAASKVSQEQVQRNKKNALAFYDMVFNDHKVKEGTEKYVADTYIQHNPTVADGPEAFIQVF